MSRPHQMRFCIHWYKAVIKSAPCRLLLTLCWVFVSFAVPLSFVHYILSGVQLRDDYVFHARLPSQQLRRELHYHDNQTEPRYWKEFVKNESRGLFQNVTQDGQALVFSGYVDDMKNSQKIRAIGAKKRNYAINITCIVWYELPKTYGGGQFRQVGVSGYITEHIEIFDRSWAVVHYMCNIEDLPSNPYAVSIMAAGTPMPPINRIVIKYTAEDPQKTYTVCLHNAFNFRTDVSTEIVEWIEVNKILGADHFMVYNFSSHANNDKVLKWYEHLGLITIVQWDLPLYVDLIFIGEVAIMQDCLYRNFYKSKYISHLDLDEYIVPRRPGVTTVPELVAALPSRCGYIVRCAVFPVADGYGVDTFEGKDLAEKYKLGTLLTRQRQNKIWKSKDRSKQLMRTACVEMAGVHQVDGYTSLVSEMTFDPSDALMQHYRRGKPRFVKFGNRTEDNFMLRYAPSLIENVSSVWKLIEKSNTSKAAPS